MSSQTMNNDTVKATFNPNSGIATLMLEMEGRANKINQAFGTGLNEALDWALANEALKGIIIGSGHKDFCVGADIDWMYKERDPVVMAEMVKQLNALYRKLETCGKPVVAALTGSALGGGYELALACHRRIALDSPKVQVGLPEVSLGVIPGAGGTQRLPRLIGLQGALDLTMQGKMLRAAKGKDAGLVDELATDRDGVMNAAEKWIADNPSPTQPWDVKGFTYPGGAQPGSDDARNLFLGAAGMLTKMTAGVYEAPKVLLSCVSEACGLKLDRALEVETRWFVHLAVGDQSKDMIRSLWYHRTAAEKQEGLPQTDEMNIQKVAILGAGMMGAGLGFICAQAGFDVVLKDIKQEGLDVGVAHVDKQIAKLKWLSDDERQAIRGRITPTLEMAALKDTDLIIEAVFENLKLKHAVTKETEPNLSPTGIWASNTSAIPITDLAEASARPEKFIGLHYFSPVEKMPLLEIIMGEKTDGSTLARCLAFARKIKKTAIVVNDGYGFYTSRTFAAYIIEAAQLVAEGHDPVLIEWAAKSAGMAVAPLQVFDEVTLSLGQHVLAQSKIYLGKAVDIDGVGLLNAMCDDHDRKGRVHGAGFYEYKDGKRQRLWPGLADLAKGKPEQTGVELLQDRLLLIQCAEVARCVESGVIRQKRDAEVGAIFGLGFAPNTGGPLSYIDRKGIGWVVERLDAFTKSYGERYACPQMLRDMAEKGETFFEQV